MSGPMLENHMVIPGPPKYFAGECATCGQELESDYRPERDEDGRPDYSRIYTGSCADCGTAICDYCRENGAAHICEDGELRCVECAVQCIVCKEWFTESETKPDFDRKTGEPLGRVCLSCIEQAEEAA
ncbi:MAG TPA: hypothetical protein PKW45_19335 [Bryobacteraceae bacterium]|nr:hypothetical protein [Bryobacteraceae bacterium]